MRVLKNIFLHFYKSSSDRSCSAELISLQPLSVLRPVDSLVIYKRKSLINYWTGEWQGVGSIRFFLRRIVLCCFFSPGRPLCRCCSRIFRGVLFSLFHYSRRWFSTCTVCAKFGKNRSKRKLRKLRLRRWTNLTFWYIWWLLLRTKCLRKFQIRLRYLFGTFKNNHLDVSWSIEVWNI